jgi:hypothetical protein
VINTNPFIPLEHGQNVNATRETNMVKPERYISDDHQTADLKRQLAEKNELKAHLSVRLRPGGSLNG